MSKKQKFKLKEDRKNIEKEEIESLKETVKQEIKKESEKNFEISLVNEIEFNVFSYEKDTGLSLKKRNIHFENFDIPMVGEVGIRSTKENFYTSLDIKNKSLKYTAFKDLFVLQELQFSKFPEFFYTDLNLKKKNIFIHKIDIELSNMEVEKLDNLNIDIEMDKEKSELLENLLDLSFSGEHLFEEIVELKEEDERSFLPKSLSELMDNPTVIVLGENDLEWHIPVSYYLKELYREIKTDYPEIIMRIPESSEEERIDSFDFNQLEDFNVEKRIEILMLKKHEYFLDDFLSLLEGRLKTSFLKRMGFLLVVVRRENIDAVYRKLKEKLRGIRIFKMNPKDENYEELCTKLTGIYDKKSFFEKYSLFKRKLEKTVNEFSFYVKRDKEGNDIHQYPYKVATFLYILKMFLAEKRVNISSRTDIEKHFLELIKEHRINTEERIEEIIPDISFEKDGDKIAVEIETFIGTTEPLKKLDETLSKYENKDMFKDIWIVLRPVSATIHYREITKRKRLWKNKLQNLSFKVLVSRNDKYFSWELLNIEDWKNYGKRKTHS